MILLYILGATVGVGLISLIGLLMFAARVNQKKISFYLISLASGTLLGSAFLHLIPASLERNPHQALFAISIGVFFFFSLEKLLIWRHCHLHQHLEDQMRTTAANMVLISDAIHNLIDGVIIATSFMADVSIGMSVTVAIILHEIPQELGDFAILIHGGFPLKRAILANAMTATAAVVGALITYAFVEASPILQSVLLPVTAGGFLYIALADLIPQLHEQVAARQAVAQILLLAVGFGVMMLFNHHGL